MLAWPDRLVPRDARDGGAPSIEPNDIDNFASCVRTRGLKHGTVLADRLRHRIFDPWVTHRISQQAQRDLLGDAWATAHLCEQLCGGDDDVEQLRAPQIVEIVGLRGARACRRSAFFHEGTNGYQVLTAELVFFDEVSGFVQLLVTGSDEMRLALGIVLELGKRGPAAARIFAELRRGWNYGHRARAILRKLHGAPLVAGYVSTNEPDRQTTGCEVLFIGVRVEGES